MCKTIVEMWKTLYFIYRKGGISQMKIQNMIEDVLIASGIAVSLADIQQVLSIILLVFNVAWILVKFGIKIYQHIKERNVQAIADDIKETHDELEQFTDSLNNQDVKQIDQKSDDKDSK